MLATKRSAGVTPEVNLKENVTHTPLPNVNKAAHSGFNTQRRHHHKSKEGYRPPNFFSNLKIDAVQFVCLEFNLFADLFVLF